MWPLETLLLRSVVWRGKKNFNFTTRVLSLTLLSFDYHWVWAGIVAMGSGSFLADNSIHFNHFTGFMMEEEIVSSLWNFVLKCVKWSESSDRTEYINEWEFLWTNCFYVYKYSINIEVKSKLEKCRRENVLKENDFVFAWWEKRFVLRNINST